MLQLINSNVFKTWRPRKALLWNLRIGFPRMDIACKQNNDYSHKGHDPQFGFSEMSWLRHQIIFFLCYWPLVRGIRRSPRNSPHKGQWLGALMFSLIYAWTSVWVNNGDAGDLRRHRCHFDVTVTVYLLRTGDDDPYTLIRPRLLRFVVNDQMTPWSRASTLMTLMLTLKFISIIIIIISISEANDNIFIRN